MKKIVILTAGGVGSRMKQEIPKQFITIKDKPIIIYTMEAFEKHPNIDGIIVVCLNGWESILQSYAKQFNITKLVSIVKGGECGQESITNGVMKAYELYKKDAIVLIHDGNRPMISQNIISDSIAKCQQYGNSITTIPCTEVIVTTKDNKTGDKLIDRNIVKRTQTPHTFYLEDLVLTLKEAKQKGITNSAAMCSLYLELDKKIYFSSGSEENLKLTTTDDIDIFEALLNAQNQNNWIRR